MLPSLVVQVKGARPVPPTRLCRAGHTMLSLLASPVTPRLVEKPDRRDAPGRQRLLARVRGEFREMACLRITVHEAARLLGLPAEVCNRILNELAAAGEIRRTADGRYTRFGAPV